MNRYGHEKTYEQITPESESICAEAIALAKLDYQQHKQTINAWNAVLIEAHMKHGTIVPGREVWAIKTVKRLRQ